MANAARTTRRRKMRLVLQQIEQLSEQIAKSNELLRELGAFIHHDDVRARYRKLEEGWLVQKEDFTILQQELSELIGGE